MTTVPKLSYTNLKHKNRAKNDESQQLSLSSKSGDLFAHMNKDNLAYIQTQIKEKRKKNNKNNQQQKKIEDNLRIQSQEIMRDDKFPATPQLLSPTIEPVLPVVKTEGEHQEIFNTQNKWTQLDRKFSHAEPQIPHKKQSYTVQQKAQKLSLLNLSELQQQGSLNYLPSQNNFLNFLENYIDDLNTPNIQSAMMNQPNKKKADDIFLVSNKVQHKDRKRYHSNMKNQKIVQNQLVNSTRIQKLEKQMMNVIQQIKYLKQSVKTQNQSIISTPLEYHERDQARSISAFGSSQYRNISRFQKSHALHNRADQNMTSYMTLGNNNTYSTGQRQKQKWLRQKLRKQKQISSKIIKQKQTKQDISRLVKQLQDFNKHGVIQLKNMTHRY